MSNVSRGCPYCAETILAKARLCKHCHREVTPIKGDGEADLPALVPVGDRPIYPGLRRPPPPKRMGAVGIVTWAVVIVLLIVGSSRIHDIQKYVLSFYEPPAKPKVEFDMPKTDDSDDALKNIEVRHGNTLNLNPHTNEVVELNTVTVANRGTIPITVNGVVLNHRSEPEFHGVWCRASGSGEIHTFTQDLCESVFSLRHVAYSKKISDIDALLGAFSILSDAYSGAFPGASSGASKKNYGTVAEAPKPLLQGDQVEFLFRADFKIIDVTLESDWGALDVHFER